MEQEQKAAEPVAETTAVATVAPKALAVKPQPSEAMLERFQEVQENLESVDTPSIPRVKLTAAGFQISEDMPPVDTVEGTIIHTRTVNQYFKDQFNPNDIKPPDCFSLDGKIPDPSSPSPQHKTCKGCPQAEFGTNSMKSSKACRNMKPLYLLMSDESIMPRQITIAPTSLKAANGFLMDMLERGLAYRKVKVKLESYLENKGDTYRKIRFTFLNKLEPQRIADVEYLKTNWMSAMEKSSVEREPEVEVTPDATAAPGEGASKDY